MFVSMPVHRFPMPTGLGLPNALYWRSVAWTTGAAWFVLTARARSDPEIHDTFLLAWDKDIVDALETTKSDLYALLVMTPMEQVIRGQTPTIEIKEIWEASESEETSDFSLVLVDTNGVQRTGPFMHPDPHTKRGRLLYVRCAQQAG